MPLAIPKLIKFGIAFVTHCEPPSDPPWLSDASTAVPGFSSVFPAQGEMMTVCTLHASTWHTLCKLYAMHSQTVCEFFANYWQSCICTAHSEVASHLQRVLNTIHNRILLIVNSIEPRSHGAQWFCCVGCTAVLHSPAPLVGGTRQL